jgi:hypothetical protein
MVKTVNEMVEHAEVLKTRDPLMYQQLVRSFHTMSDGGDAGPAEAWSMYTIRSEYYPGWSDEDFSTVLERIGEA